jgi:hypothetical protein
MKKILYFIIILSFTGVCAQNWQAIDNGLSGAVRALLPDTTNNQLIIGGEFSYIHGALHRSIAKYDGVAIDSMGVFSCNPIFALGSCRGTVYATDCNTMFVRDPNTQQNLWLPIDSGFSGTALCYYTKDSVLYVGGGFNAVGQITSGSLAYWNGQRFRDIALPYAYGMVSDITFFRDTMYVVADFPDSTGGTSSRVLRRTCSCRGWIDITPVFGSTSSWASSLEVYKNELYLAGSFSKADGCIGNSILKYDGILWHDVANGIDQSGSYGQVFELHVFRDVLFVGGFFQSANGIAANNIVVWDSTDWHGLGGTFNQSIMAINDWNNELYIGGRFTVVDGAQTNYIAKYIGALPW